MAIRNVVTRGYGAGSTIAFVVTRGYSVGVTQVPDADGLEYRIPTSLMQYTAPGGPLEYDGDK